MVKFQAKDFADAESNFPIHEQKTKIKITQARRNGKCKAKAYLRKSSRT